MTILILIVLAAALALALERPLERTVQVVLAGTALVTYCATLAGHKSSALPVMAVCAGAACLTAVVRCRKAGAGRCVALLIRPGVFALVLAMAAGWLLMRQIRFVMLDDLLHWALFSKQMCGLEAFPEGARLASAYADYPPGAQMLLVFLQIGQPFSHPMLFWGQLLWYTGLTLPLLEKTSEGGRLRQAAAAVGGAVFLLLFPALFNHYYTESLVVEPLMGLMLGCMAYTAWRGRTGPDLLDGLTVSLLACLLVLTKSTGVLYAAAGLLAVAILWRQALFCSKGRARRLAFAGVTVAAAAGLWQSWRWLCAAKGYVSYFTEDAPQAYTLDNLTAFLKGEGLAGQVIPSFLRALAVQPLAKRWGLSALAMLAVVWALACLLPRLRRQELRPVLAVFTLIFVVYAASVCYSYVYLFQEGEALTLSAFSRYIGPLPTGALYLVLGAAVWQYWGRGKPLAWCCAGAAFLACLNWQAPARWLPGAYQTVFEQFMGDQASGVDGILQEAEALHDCLEPTDRVLAITQTSSMDRLGQLLRYALLPNQVEYWSPTECGDSHGLSLRWNEYLVEQGFEYVYCAADGQPTADQEMLTDQAGTPVRSGWLYRVNTEDGAVQLEPVCQPG